MQILNIFRMHNLKYVVEISSFGWMQKSARAAVKLIRSDVKKNLVTPLAGVGVAPVLATLEPQSTHFSMRVHSPKSKASEKILGSEKSPFELLLILKKWTRRKTLFVARKDQAY